MIGLRAGWGSRSGLFYFLDYSINQFILDTEQSGAYSDDEVSKSQVGLLVGKSFGATKLWATYFLQSEIEGGAGGNSCSVTSGERIWIVSFASTSCPIAYSDDDIGTIYAATSGGVSISTNSSVSFVNKTTANIKKIGDFSTPYL